MNASLVLDWNIIIIIRYYQRLVFGVLGHSAWAWTLNDDRKQFYSHQFRLSQPILKLSKFPNDWCVEILAMQRPVGRFSFMVLMPSAISWLMIYLKMIDSLALGESRNEKTYFISFHSNSIILVKQRHKEVCLVINWHEKNPGHQS